MSAPSGYTALDFVGFTDKGTYSPIVKYMRNDLVHYGGNIMRCKVDDTMNVTPVEGANWELWVGASANLVERTIAPLENNPADVAFGVGRQIIYDDWLWEVIAPIAVGDALIDYAVDPTNANIKKSAPVETQLLAVKAEADATDNMIAPTEASASSSSAPYSVGDQLILNNILYDVIAAIQIGDALTTGTGGNIAAADTLTDQLNAKANSSELAAVNSSIQTLTNNTIHKKDFYIDALNPPSGLDALDPTNTNDNTSKLQSIIDYIAGLTFPPYLGACIFFPRGTYKINGTINVNTSHVRFLGEENGATRFETTTTTSGGKDMFYVTANFVQFEEIAFWVMGDNTYENTFVHGNGARKLSIENCMLYDAKNAIVFNNGPGVRCNNVTVAFNAITYSGAIGWNFKGLCNSSYLLNCVASMSTSNSIGLKLEDHPQDIFIEHLETSRGLYGIEITSDGTSKVADLQILDCVIDEPASYGIYIHDLTDVSELSILGGNIMPLSNGAKGIRIDNAKNIKINSLKVLNYHNLTNVDGISFGGTIENIMIEGCYFYDMIRSLIYPNVASNAGKSIMFNNNLVVNNTQTGGTTHLSKTNSGSISNNVYRGNIVDAIHVDSTSSNIMCIGNSGLTDAACTNTYNGAYNPSGFGTTLTNNFIVD